MDDDGILLFKGSWPDDPDPLPAIEVLLPFRTYTDVDGRQVEARIHSVQGTFVTLTTRKKKQYTIPIARFSREDRLFSNGFAGPEN